jgi:hypothetical protein
MTRKLLFTLLISAACGVANRAARAANAPTSQPAPAMAPSVPTAPAAAPASQPANNNDANTINGNNNNNNNNGNNRWNRNRNRGDTGNNSNARDNRNAGSDNSNGGGGGGNNTAPRGTGYNDRYGVIAERNIFLKDRRAASASAAGRNGQGNAPGGNNGSGPARPTGEKALVLTGVAMERDGFRAYLEDLERNVVQKVAVGDPLARGRVAEIEIDAICYQTPAGQLTWVTVGDDLTGRRAEVPVADYAASSAAATTMPSGIEGLNPNDPNLTMEQKMKLKRAAELAPRP